MSQEAEYLINIPELNFNSIKNEENEVHIFCEAKINFCYCPHCKEKIYFVKRYNVRKIRDLSICGKTTYLHLKTRQFRCNKHHEYFFENFTFVSTNAVFTDRYKKYIYESCKGVDIKYVADRENISWDTVNSIFKKISEQEINKENRISKVRYLGIDEISLLKGHKDFATVLVDLERGKVVEFLPERTKEYLINYFKNLGQEFCNQIIAVSSDMWDGFTSLAGNVFPNAEHVVDRFHFFCPSTNN
jgi:transposase